MIGIAEEVRERIGKYRQRLFEGDPVTIKVLFRLLGIPFKLRNNHRSVPRDIDRVRYPATNIVDPNCLTMTSRISGTSRSGTTRPDSGKR